MEWENIILSEVSQFRRPKATFSLMWNTDLTQIQQYYEKQVTLRGGDIQEEDKRGKLRK
jgi:hypothetical protein